jgi:hypothetical protein
MVRNELKIFNLNNIIKNKLNFVNRVETMEADFIPKQLTGRTLEEKDPFVARIHSRSTCLTEEQNRSKSSDLHDDDDDDDNFTVLSVARLYDIEW